MSFWAECHPEVRTLEQEVQGIQGEETVGQTSLREEHCYRLPTADTSPALWSLIDLASTLARSVVTSDTRVLLVTSDRGAQTTGPRCCGIEEQKRGINILPLIPQGPPPHPPGEPIYHQQSYTLTVRIHSLY